MPEQENSTPGANQPLMVDESKKPLDSERGSYEQAVFTKEVDQVEVKAPPQFIGLTKEELERYRNDPFWKRLRMLLFVLFWVAWIGMFVLAIVIVATSPKCPPKVQPHWWQSKLCYQVWTSSFKDSNADGYGDLVGLTDKLDGLKKVGVQTVWPVNLLQSKQLGGYEVSDFKKVDKRIGTNEDFKKLVKSAHGKIPKMYVIMDFPTTTSTEHDWFKKSSAKTPGYENFYFWFEEVLVLDPEYYSEDGNGRYYFHIEQKPDMAVLNWDAVENNMTDVLTYWLDQGVDGFYVAHLQYMTGKKPTEIADEDWTKIIAYTNSMNVTVENWRDANDDKDRELLLFTSLEGSAVSDHTKVNNLVVSGGLNYVINKDLMDFNADTGDLATELKKAVEEKVKFHSDFNDTWPMWELGHPYKSRLSTRFKSRTLGELMNLVLLTLPGSINVYYGDEILMVDWNGTDPEFINRAMRSSMQWDDDTETHGGFSEAKDVKVPVNNDYKTINFEAQYGNPGTPLKMFRRMAKLRLTDDTFLNGNYTLGTVDDGVYTFARYPTEISGSKRIYVGAMNFGDHIVNVDFTKLGHTIGKSGGSVVTATSNAAQKYPELSEIGDLSAVELGVQHGIVIKYTAE